MIIPRKFAELGSSDQELIIAAREASANAYAPYSGFAVGAAVSTRSGALHTGANLENASYGLSMCAEVAAITAANSQGDYNIEAMAVVGHKFSDPRNIEQVVTPCGRCRQLIFEASEIAGTDLRVFSCSGDLDRILEARAAADLLPEGFGPKNLGLQDAWPQMRAKLARSVEELRTKAPAVGRGYSQPLRRRR